MARRDGDQGTIDGCGYFEYQIYACDEPNLHADSCFAVITDADAPDNAGRANDLTTSTDCVDQGHLGAVLTKGECANAYYYLRQNPQEDAAQETGGGLPSTTRSGLTAAAVGIEPGRVVLGDASDGTQNMETWPRQICRTACPGSADSTADAPLSPSPPPSGFSDLRRMQIPTGRLRRRTARTRTSGRDPQHRGEVGGGVGARTTTGRHGSAAPVSRSLCAIRPSARGPMARRCLHVVRRRRPTTKRGWLSLPTIQQPVTAA